MPPRVDDARVRVFMDNLARAATAPTIAEQLVRFPAVDAQALRVAVVDLGVRPG